MGDGRDRAPRGNVEVAVRATAAPGPCDVCGAPTVEVRCKIICRSCGYTRDCSDP